MAKSAPERSIEDTERITRRASVVSRRRWDASQPAAPSLETSEQVHKLTSLERAFLIEQPDLKLQVTTGMNCR
jgi:hypothetical protein